MLINRAVSIAASALLITGIAGCAIDSASTNHRAAALGLLDRAQPQRFFIRWSPDSTSTNSAFVSVEGLSHDDLRQLQQASRQWPQLLAVYVSQGDLITDASVPAMLGRYSIRDGNFVFEPRFPFEPGVRYRAIFQPSRFPSASVHQSALVMSVFELPPPAPTASTSVSRVYPTADRLPENLLKFYVYFSAPMSRGRIYSHIELLNESNAPIELPFLEIDEELWDPTMTRLTLFIDPGRIKRGVLPLEEVGPALESGKSYTLVIHQAWKDATGNPLRETYRKRFLVGPPDRELTNPANWKLGIPGPGTRSPLLVDFHESMDHALAQRLIVVTTKTGEPVAGTINLSDQEQRWYFVPNELWRSGAHKLVVRTTLEDLAGNNIGKPFEVDLFENVERQSISTSVELPFEVP